MSPRVRRDVGPSTTRPGRGGQNRLVPSVPADPTATRTAHRAQEVGRLPTDLIRPPAPSRRNDLGQPVGCDVVYRGAAVPTARTLAGSFARLVPLRLDHAADLLAAMRSAGGDELWTYLPFPPCRSAEELAAHLRPVLREPGRICFALLVSDRANGSDTARAGEAPAAGVADTGSVAGMVALQRVDARNGTLEVAFVMYGAGARRAAPGTEAIYLLARHVFEDLGFRRLEWKCDALHAGSRRAAARFGFGFEGVWRNAIVMKARTRDTAWYAMTDGDWAGLRRGYEAWFTQCNRPDTRPLRDFLPG